MKNILISVAISLLAFGLGMYVGNNWVAGIPTFMIAFCIVFFLMTRKTMRKLETVLKGAGEVAQKAQQASSTSVATTHVEKALGMLESGLSLSKEQFGLEALIHSQMGAMHYQLAGMEFQQKTAAESQRQSVKIVQHHKAAKKRLASAKVHLEIAAQSLWVSKITRSWHSAGMLASLRSRDGLHEEALKIMSSVRGPGASDPLYWGLRAFLSLEADNPTDALLYVEEGKSKSPSSEALALLSEQISNRKTVDMFVFGMNWFMFFPEHLTPEIIMKLQQEGQVNAPTNRAMRRAIKKRGN